MNLRHTPFSAAALTAIILAGATALPTAADPYEPWSLSVDVWTEDAREDYYYEGETVRAYVRPNRDAYVVVYGADVDGVLHLLYPFDEYSPRRIEAGDVIELDGPFLHVGAADGIVYIEALVSEYPIEPRLPSYFFGVRRAQRGYRWDYAGVRVSPHGVIIGDPHLALAELRHALVPRGCAPYARAHATFSFRVGHRRHYPRYLCADCHLGSWYDPYGDACSVFEIRVDALWSDTRYWNRCEPRYYYRKRPVVAHPYRGYKTTWSSKDGPDLLGRTFSVKSPREKRFLRERGREDLVAGPPVRGGDKPTRGIRGGRPDDRTRTDRSRVTRDRPTRSGERPSKGEVRRPDRPTKKSEPRVERRRDRARESDAKKVDRPPRRDDRKGQKPRSAPKKSDKKKSDKKKPEKKPEKKPDKSKDRKSEGRDRRPR